MNEASAIATNTEELTCELEDVAAYVDGELADDRLECFENHLKTCARCAIELRNQRQLLCTLNVAFNSSSFSLPHDFTRIVTARAESDLRGIRNQSERRRAVGLCAVLAAIAFALMGAAARGIIFDPVRSFFTAAERVLDLTLHAGVNIAESAVVIVRVITRAMFLAPSGFGVMLLLGFAVSISFLPVLIARYHRAAI